MERELTEEEKEEIVEYLIAAVDIIFSNIEFQVTSRWTMLVLEFWNSLFFGKNTPVVLGMFFCVPMSLFLTVWPLIAFDIISQPIRNIFGLNSEVLNAWYWDFKDEESND